MKNWPFAMGLSNIAETISLVKGKHLLEKLTKIIASEFIFESNHLEINLSHTIPQIYFGNAQEITPKLLILEKDSFTNVKESRSAIFLTSRSTPPLDSFEHPSLSYSLNNI